MCREERLVVAVSGGWSGVAGGFLNNGQTRPPASEGGRENKQ